MVVCREVWTLGGLRELACYKRLFNPPPQFTRLGTWCPTFLCASVFVLCTLMGGVGELFHLYVWLITIYGFINLFMCKCAVCLVYLDGRVGGGG